MAAVVEEILAFWLGDVDEHGASPLEVQRRWWKKDEAFDEEIRRRFLSEYEAVVAGQREHWLDSARGRLASILVLDQFARNMFRGTPKMYAADEQALGWALEGIERGMDREVGFSGRCFFYMPLMHAEEVAHQDRCVALFEAFHGECCEAQVVGEELLEQLSRSCESARKHREFVATWGRFPHRNAILGRASTEAELEFLSQPGSGF